MKIIVVDDTPEIRSVLSEILSAKNYEVKTAATATEGLVLMKKENFDVGLIDINLPDIEGLELIKIFKSLQPQIESIIITGNASIENAVKAMENGAFAYLTKPFEMSEVLISVQRAIEKQKNDTALKRKIAELEEFNEITKARETTEAELKKEVNSLLARLGRPSKY
jgi:two-component system NtrC family response regulator